MDYNKAIEELSRNKDVFKELLTGLQKETYLWKQNPEKWCLLEIVCHLYDEEREDFRTRVKHVLETPHIPPPLFNPIIWVTERKYIEQDYNSKLTSFLTEREKSIKWLQSLQNPNWENAYNHSKFGEMSAKMFFTNWLAHDYLHIRQILNLKFDYLKNLSNESLEYAGNW